MKKSSEYCTYYQKYNNFVRPSSMEDVKKSIISGEDAKNLYIEEIDTTKHHRNRAVNHDMRTNVNICNHKTKILEVDMSNHKLFKIVQNNNVDRLQHILETCPDKINFVDEFGWSLLMIACQANSVDIVKELLKRGVDTTVRDKAGNSAQSLVISNKNYVLADILLSHLQPSSTNKTINRNNNLIRKKKVEEKYLCTTCDGKYFDNEKEHLVSTVHNINASKGRKVSTKYVIPESNKGYQIMLKVGWDKEAGLGPDGTGKIYPIRTVQKTDKKGLGHKKIKKAESVNNKESSRILNKKAFEYDYEKNRRMEISFRREFY